MLFICQGLVRFCALYRIKPHAPPLVLAGEVLSTGFPLWVTIASVLGLMKPSYFNWVTPKLSIMGLNIIMLGMGMTLTLDDLRGVLAMPKEVLSGFLIQYSVSVLALWWLFGICMVYYFMLFYGVLCSKLVIF